MNVKTGVSIVGDCDFSAAVEFLKKQKVVVGVTAGTAGRAGGISNAALLYIHSNGSPRQGIPARPVVEPAMEDGGTQAAIAGLMGEAAAEAMDGNYGGAAAALNSAGEAGANAVKERFGGALVDTGALRAAIAHEIR